MAVADHLVQHDRLAAVGDRREESARLDLAELSGIADQDQLGVGRLGVVDQAGEGCRVDHPRLVDQQHRAGLHRRPALVRLPVEVGKKPRDAGRVEPL